MQNDLSKTQRSFARLLRAFQTGGICYDDLLAQLDQYLLAGAMRAELLETLRRRESVEPLADDVYLAIWSRLRRVVHDGTNATARAESPAHAGRPMALAPSAVSATE